MKYLFVILLSCIIVQSANPPLVEPINIKRDFGAKGDGSDDTVAIQAAADYGTNITVYFPNGRYSTTGLVVTNIGVKFLGDGYESVLIRRADTTNVTINVLAQQFQIRNMRMEGGLNFNAASDLIRVYNVSDTTIDHVWFYGGYRHVNLTYGNSHTINLCTFELAKASAVYDLQASLDQIINNKFFDAGRVEDVNNVTAAIQLDSDNTFTFPSYSAIISGNTFRKGEYAHGIYARTNAALLISGNTFNLSGAFNANTRDDIKLSSCSNVVITANTATGLNNDYIPGNRASRYCVNIADTNNAKIRIFANNFEPGISGTVNDLALNTDYNIEDGSLQYSPANFKTNVNVLKLWINGGSAADVTDPAVRIMNNKTITWTDSNGGVLNSGFLFLDGTNVLHIGASNATQMYMYGNLVSVPVNTDIALSNVLAGSALRVGSDNKVKAIAYGAGLVWDGTTLTIATNSSGSSSNAYSRVFEDGSGLTARTNLNFIGPTFTAQDNAPSNWTEIVIAPNVNWIATNSGNGYLVKTASGTGRTSSIAGGTNIFVSNGDGTAGNTTVNYSGSASVSSVGLTMPAGFTVTSSPVTNSGTLVVTIPGGQPYLFLRGDGTTNGVTWDNALQLQNANNNAAAVIGVVKRGRLGDSNATPATASILGQFGIGGWNGSGYIQIPVIQGYTTENWTGGANGMQLRFNVIPTGSTTGIRALTLDQNGDILFGSTNLAGHLAGKQPLITTGFGLTNSSGNAAGPWSNNITAGTGISITAGASGQLSIANTQTSSGYDGGYITKVFVDATPVNLVTFALPVNLRGATAFIEGQFQVTTASSVSVKNFKNEVIIARVDATGGHTAVSQSTVNECNCAPGDILIGDNGGAFGPSVGSVTIQMTAHPLFVGATSITCMFKVRVVGAATVTFP